MPFSEKHSRPPREQSPPLFSKRNLAVFVLLGVLSYITLATFTGLEFTSGDDAGWYRITDPQARANIIYDWAASQGRIYAYLAGPLMVFANGWATTPLGEFLQFAPYFVACLCFALAINAYFSDRLALVTLTLLLGLMALRFDLSAVTAYPLYVFPFVSLLLLSTIAMRRYALRGGRPMLVLSMGLLLLSYVTHETITLLAIGIGGLAVLANLSACEGRLSPSLRLSSITRRGRALLIGYGFVTLFYMALYIAFSVAHPSTYDGHFSDFSQPAASLSLFWSFAFNGSVLFGFWEPYAIQYSFRAITSGLKLEYGPITEFATAFANPLAMLFGMAAAAGLWRALTDAKQSTPRVEKPVGIPLGYAIPPAIAFIVLPVILVTISSKYLDWHENLGVNAYITTGVAHFGVALLLGALLLFALDLLGRKPSAHLALAAGICILFGLLAATNQNINGEIADEHRKHAARWEAFDRGLALIEEAGLAVDHLHLPQFQSGSWHGVVSLEDWRLLAAGKYAVDLELHEGPGLPSIEGEAASLLFWPDAQGRNPVVVVAKLDLSDPYLPSISTLAIDARARPPKDRRGLVLSYVEHHAGPKQRLFDRLPPAGPGTPMILRGLDIVPSTIQVQDILVSNSLILPCGETVSPGVTLVFGKDDRQLYRSCSMTNRLDEAWHQPENLGSWTVAKKASVDLPQMKSGPEGLRLTLLMNTLSSRGHLPETQRVTVSSGGEILATREFSKDMRGGGTLSVDLTPERAASLDRLTFTVDAPANLKERGISQDDRLLGVYVRKIRIEPLSP